MTLKFTVTRSSFTGNGERIATDETFKNRQKAIEYRDETLKNYPDSDARIVVIDERPVTLSNIISNRIFDSGEWRDMTEDERTENLEKIKAVLFSECRGKNTLIYAAIGRMSITNLPGNQSILDRLSTEGYSAAQDYELEMRYVKNVIRREC